ncbi:hypothetical protein QEN19_004194 [Hanseniaspora menglaensis]
MIPVRNYSTAIKTLTLGIDLGTTNTLASYIPSGTRTPKILSQTKISSVVAYKTKKIGETERADSILKRLINNSSVLVGDKAINQSRLNQQNTFKAMKRVIGTSDPQSEAFILFKKQYPHHMYIENTVKFDVDEGEVDAVNIASQILNEVRVQALDELVMNKISNDKTKKEIEKLSQVDAVITVPAYFNNLQRKATLEAAKLAGINCLRIINEPTAAALSFGILQQQENRDGVFAVYDLGGGTFDISLLELDGSVFEVRGTSGDLQLGGEDLDYLLRQFAIEKFAKQDNLLKQDMLNDDGFMNELLKSCENCKIELSKVSSTEIAIPFAFRNSKSKDMVNFKISIEEAELDKLAEPMIKKTLKLFKRCLKDAKIDKKLIKQVLLVGGMTRMPYIRNLLKENFSKDSTTIINSNINPDDSVCLGASIQAGLLKGEIEDVLLLDVNPLTLGMETYGGIMSPMLAKNCNVPIEVKEQFTTGIDNQQIVKIVIYQGESNLCRDNVKLGEFMLSGIPQLPKGVPKIEVSFKLDSNGILNVSAKEVLTGLECELELITTAPVEKNVANKTNSNVDSSDLKWVFENLGLWQLAFKEIELQMRQYSEYIDKSLVSEFNDLKSNFVTWEEFKSDSEKDEFMVRHFVKEKGMELLKKRVNKLQTDFMEQLKNKKL